MIPEIDILDFNYTLPDERIAKYPLLKRDLSKLLLYKDGQPSEFQFRDLPSLLPDNAMMVFNDTKVVPARLHFKKTTGAHIEIFCLEPHTPAEYAENFASTSSCRWKCIVGNIKKWKGDVLRPYNPENDTDIENSGLTATLVERIGETSIVEFAWTDGSAFSQILELCGSVPIPPYLNRETESVDLERYQTLYAKYRGSVAAPTAGLHFTEDVLTDIRSKGIDMETVCLHVGAGTFLPVKSRNIGNHTMHREPFVVSIDLLRRLRDKKVPLVAVGTTSVRTLESLYYAGVKCIEDGAPSDVCQWEPYMRTYQYSTFEALDALVKYLEKENRNSLQIGTRIIIVPGFEFRFVDYLVTNFHQPQSTLLLLVSAFVGGDWKTAYEFAMSHGFRFLSYGDSSLLVRNRA